MENKISSFDYCWAGGEGGSTGIPHSTQVCPGHSKPSQPHRAESTENLQFQPWTQKQAGSYLWIGFL